MQGALILNQSPYTIIAERPGQGNFSSIDRFSSFRLVVNSSRAATQHHARVYGPSQTRRLEICKLKVSI
jgi:hypothetical protein